MKERFQNPTSNDLVRLRLFTYNANSFADVELIEKVEIYYIDSNEVSEKNSQGLRLVDTIDGTAIQQEDTGHYILDLQLEADKYLIGRYVDVWTLYPVVDQPVQKVENFFDVYPNMWYTTASPVVYDFSFRFRPNRIRKGSKQYIITEITPNVPKASDLCRYYENIIIGADISIFVEQACGPCVPEESDLALVVEDEPIQMREKNFAYYQIDTEEYDTGIYNVWFKLEFGTNVYLSDKMQLEIY